ncbi:hypothetical protein ANCCEY_13325 [Ancylostoma ceylanicum]|uniref:TIL domain-containing protein n=1 Tax=Ancylostoma ceylanicum TaxID=53326 RepID=A0A0D6L925_9BILA|nr:hypothetical protein ANCCEY_13325 [Ancylostoma ceylanicum]
MVVLFLLLRLSSQTTPESSGEIPAPADSLASGEIATTGILTSGEILASGECDDNEVMMECGPECEGVCALDVCRCKQGFIRSKPEGPCIEASACPSVPSEVYPDSCENVECPKYTHCEVVDLPCQNGNCIQEAVCVDDYIFS